MARMIDLNKKRVQRIKELIDELQRVIDNQYMRIEQLEETIRNMREENEDDET